MKILILNNSMNRVIRKIKKDEKIFNPNKSLKYACQLGNIQMINIMVSYGATDWNYGLLGACKKGDIEIIKLAIKNGGKNFIQAVRALYTNANISNLHDEIFLLLIEQNNIICDKENTKKPDIKDFYFCGLLGACKSGNITNIDKLFQKIKEIGDLNNVDDQYKIFESVCKSGNIDAYQYVYEYMKNTIKCEKDINNCNLYSFNGACRNGNIELIKLILEKHNNLCNICSHQSDNINKCIHTIEKNNYFLNSGLLLACASGNIDTVNFLINNGASNWNAGLYGGCLGNREDIINMMVEKGASYWGTAMEYACIKGHYNIVLKLISLGAKNFDLCYYISLDRGYIKLSELLLIHRKNILNDSLK